MGAPVAHVRDGRHSQYYFTVSLCWITLWVRSHSVSTVIKKRATWTTSSDSIASPHRLRATADGDGSRQTLPRRLHAARRADQILGDVQGAWLITTRHESASHTRSSYMLNVHIQLVWCRRWRRAVSRTWAITRTLSSPARTWASRCSRAWDGRRAAASAHAPAASSIQSTSATRLLYTYPHPPLGAFTTWFNVLKSVPEYGRIWMSCTRGAVNRDGAGLGASGLEGGSRNSYGLTAEDDEYSAYRKRMMLAYKFRPNPLVRFNLHWSLRSSLQISI